jgi:hypothetical protein
LAARPAAAWAFLALLVLAAALLVLLAPAEATIGQGIRIVYIHVALIWTGLLLLLVAGLLGLAVLIAGPGRLAIWMQLVAYTGLGFFAAGVLTSLAAEIVNWGGIAWREPRTAANLNLLAVAVIIGVANTLLPNPRLRGALNLLLAVAAVWITVTTELQLHPANAVGTATSSAIQLTFYGLAALCLLVAACLILYARGRQLASATQPSDLPGNDGSDKSGRSPNSGN